MRTEQENNWLTRTEDLALYLNRTDEPVTFFLGAGASLTSGAPNTGTVFDAFAQSLSGRIPEQADISRYIHRISPHEKFMAVRHLFASVTPYIGYLCLAALGKTRKVIVVNLNWDLAVETACDLLGTRCESLDIEDGNTGIEEALKDGGRGVVCLHLHGRMSEEGNIRFGKLETLKFDGEARSALKECFAHATIVAGASLRGDTDVLSILDDLAKERGRNGQRIRPVWLLSRDHRDLREDGAAIEWMRSRISDLNLVEDAKVDFDQLLVQIQSHILGRPYDELARSNRHLQLPSQKELVYPKPSLFREHLARRVAVLSGDPFLGKTTAAHYLAHWFQLFKGPELGVKWADGPRHCIQALASVKGSRDPSVLILEDPFGSTDEYEPNPKFIEELEQTEISPDGNFVIVTTRPSNWEKAAQERGIPPAVSVVSASPEEWYEKSDLLALLSDHSPAGIRQAIETGLINTPAWVKYSLATGKKDFGPQVTIAREKASHLRTKTDAAILLGLVRLQQLSNEPKTVGELGAAMGLETLSPPVSLEGLSGYLNVYDLDGDTYARITQPSTIEAVDQLLREAGGFLRPWLKSLGKAVPWIRDALSVWNAMEASRHGKFEAVRRLGPNLLAEWGSSVFAVSGNKDEALQCLPIEKLDFWSLCDLVYEIVLLWPVLYKSDVAQDLLSTILSDRGRMGAYAVLEAALYLQHANDDDIWSRLEPVIWEMVRKPDNFNFETALIFDGLLWRPAPGLRTVEWMRRFQENIPPDHPIVGAAAFAGIYHPDGTAMLLSKGVGDPTKPVGGLSDGQADQFTRMMVFHFLHQSRTRAIIHRRDFASENLQYLRRGTYESSVPLDHSAKLESAFDRMSASPQNAGWAFHLGLNISMVNGTSVPPKRLTGILERCRSSDLGVVTAAATYDLPDGLLPQVQGYFEDPGSRDMLLDACWKGVDLEHTNVAPPRFIFRQDPYRLQKLLRIKWSRLERFQVDTRDGKELVARLIERSKEAVSAYGAEQRIVDHIISRALQGDLRPLEDAAAARGEVSDSYLSVLVNAAVTLQEAKRSLNLFGEEI